MKIRHVPRNYFNILFWRDPLRFNHLAHGFDEDLGVFVEIATIIGESVCVLSLPRLNEFLLEAVIGSTIY